MEVEGPAYDEDDKLVREGDIVAELDDTRYRLQVKALEARLNATRNELKAQRIDLERVAQANLRAAKARLRVSKDEVAAAHKQVDAAQAVLTLAQRTLRREKELIRDGAGTRQALDDAQSKHDAAVARKAQAGAGLRAKESLESAQEATVSMAAASIALKEAEVDATGARIDQIGEELENAREDVADCKLRAPFNGRITRLHMAQGAVVAPGRPVATLTLMDPIQVQVSVSADEDRRIRAGDRAVLYPKDPIQPERATIPVNVIVYKKGEVADPRLRTFRVELMARNSRRRIDQIHPETRGLPVVAEFLPVVRRYEGEEGALYVHTGCVLRDGGKSYVLRLPGVKFDAAASRGAVGKHIPERIEVFFGDEYLTVIKWNFRSLATNGDLSEGDFLVVAPEKEHLAGLAIGSPHWLLRPGDLVPVHFTLGVAPRGFYVPVEAITKVGGAHAVFVAEDGIARLRKVAVKETFRDLRRIEGDGIAPGVALILGGVHYVSDGQAITIVEAERLPE